MGTALFRGEEGDEGDEEDGGTILSWSHSAAAGG